MLKRRFFAGGMESFSEISSWVSEFSRAIEKAVVEQVTPDECLRNFREFIKSQKIGLGIFYGDQALADRAEDAAKMVNELCKMGCDKETSKQLSILCLYDIVLLIGMYCSNSI